MHAGKSSSPQAALVPHRMPLDSAESHSQFRGIGWQKQVLSEILTFRNAGESHYKDGRIDEFVREMIKVEQGMGGDEATIRVGVRVPRLSVSPVSPARWTAESSLTRFEVALSAAILLAGRRKEADHAATAQTPRLLSTVRRV